MRASVARARRVGVGAGVAALHLGAPASLVQIVSRFLLGGSARLDAIVDRQRAAGPGEARGYAFVLNNLSFALDGGHAALHAHRELVGVDLGLGELGADGGFDLLVRFLRRGLLGRRRRSCPLMRRVWLGLAEARGRQGQPDCQQGWEFSHILQLPRGSEVLRNLCYSEGFSRLFLVSCPNRSYCKVRFWARRSSF